MHVNENTNAPSELISPFAQLKNGSSMWSGIGFQTVLYTIDSNKISFSGQWGQTLSKVLHILINRTCCSLIIN